MIVKPTKRRSTKQAREKRQQALLQLDNLLGQANRKSLVEAIDSKIIDTGDIIEIAQAMKQLKQYGSAIGFQGLPYKNMGVDAHRCQFCGAVLVLKQQRLDSSRRFWGCSQFPKCRYTESYIS